MTRDVKQYIQNCYTNKKTKTFKKRYHELLNFSFVLNHFWINIILNFVIRLFENREYNVILMIIDRLSKMHHYISCITDDNEITTEEIVKLLIQHVWKLHELFTIMIFDKDSQFISLMWNTIYKMLKIKTKLSVAFHSKIDEQSEISDQKMKWYLRAYVNHQQDDWVDWLFMIKYAFNASIFAIIQIFFFLVNYEFESRMSFDFFSSKNNIVRERIQRSREREIVFIMKKIWIFVKKHMKKNQHNQVTHANRHKSKTLDYQVENQVWLSTKNIQIDCWWYVSWLLDVGW